MEDIIDIIVTETTNTIEITAQPNDEVIDVNIIDNREDVTLNVTPTVVEININSLTGNFGVEWGDITGTISNQTDLNTALSLKADLVDGKVPSSQLPSYVDDVVEVANYASLPATGEVGKIYITLDTNFIYRWAGSVYVEIKDSSAVWGAITGTLSNQTDLQNALNAKANDNAVVHLAGTETITGAKTFSSAVTAPNFVLSGGTGNTGLYYGHTDRVVLANYTAGGIDFEVNGGAIVATLFPSGNYGLGITLDAGYKLDVNGTARISGALSGTSASFSSSVTASSIIKSGGTSSQFLKADGSVDSNSYLNTAGGTMTGVLFATSASFSGFVGFGGNTSPLAAIDVTGAGIFSSSVRSSGYYLTGMTSGSGALYYSSGSNRVTFANYNTSGTLHFEVNGGTGALTLNADTSATFTGQINSITGVFGTKGGGSYGVLISDNDQSNVRLKFTNTGSGGRSYSIVGGLPGANNSSFAIYDETAGSTRFNISDTGAATFSSSVTATSFNLGNGQFLRLTRNSGSLQYDALGIVAGTDNTRLLSTGDFDVVNGSLTSLFKIASTGAATFSSSVTIASTIQANYVNIQAGGNAEVANINSTNANGGYLTWQTNGSVIADIGTLQQIFGSGGSTNFGINARGARDLAFGSNNTERLRITSSGNVGIGTTSPTAFSGYTTLTIDNTSGSFTEYRQGGTNTFRVGSNESSGGFLYTQGSTPIRFGTIDTERMRITSVGFLGVNQTSPAQRLDVSGAIRSGVGISNGAAIAKAIGRTLYKVIISSNYDAGGAVRGGEWNVLLSNEGDAVTNTTQIYNYNNQSATFTVSGGNLIVNSLSSGNTICAVYTN